MMALQPSDAIIRVRDITVQFGSTRVLDGLNLDVKRGVFERLDDAYLVILQDGPHVIFDWGYACVDDLIAGYLGEDRNAWREYDATALIESRG